MKAHILVVEDEEDMRNGLCRMLSREGHAVQGAATGDEAIARLESSVFDAVITDLRLPGADGVAVLRKLKQVSPESPGIVITGYSTVESAVEAMKLGAYDYLSKPFDLQKVKVSVQNALQHSSLVRQNKYLRQKANTQWQVERIIGDSDIMRELLRTAEKVAPSDTTVLVLGESGTGKELISRLIHHLSARRDGMFLPVNCAMLRDMFLESELFGHVKGAFTGAVSAKRGLLELAHEGTLFLDEIGDVSPVVQAKLLRVLEDRCFMRLGGTETIHANLRLIAATNRDIEARVREGSFREDLYYRLSVFEMRLPPLRDRQEDIPLLAYHFLEKHSQRLCKHVRTITPEAMQALIYYDWRGNVRELENAIEGGVILSEGEALTHRELPIRISSGEPLQDPVPTVLSYREAKRQMLDRFNRVFVYRLLSRHHGNVTQAAEEAKMDRANFQRLMRSVGATSEKKS